VTSADRTRIAYSTLGAGEPVIVVGGVLRTAEDYLPFAADLAQEFEVHLIDRRGRGRSGPQGRDYSIEKECEDLTVLQAETGATRAFGHSYGGLVVLETAKRTPALRQLAVYEPGVSVGQSIPTDWIPAYSELLARGETRAAFARFVQGAGHAPAILRRMPLGCVKLALRLAIDEAQWRRMEPLLAANLAEHEQVRRLDGTSSSYERIAAQVLLLGGSKSPRSSTLALEVLDGVLASAQVELLPGLAHNAPDETSPARVAERVKGFFQSPGSP
jgi:pimeloyl-ACP methyl ester carboxylesterase